MQRNPKHSKNKVKQLPLETEGLIILLELFKLQLVPLTPTLFATVCKIRRKYFKKLSKVDDRPKVDQSIDLFQIKTDSQKDKKDPKQQLEQQISDVRSIIMEIRRELIQNSGRLYRIDTEDKFEALLQVENHQHVKKLRREIDDVIKAILRGDTDENGKAVQSSPRLEVRLEDPVLEDNVDLFIQIVSKLMAVERYLQYHEVQKIFLLHQ